MTQPRHAALRDRRAQLALEFVALYLIAPLVMALLLPPQWMFPALFAVTAIGLVLLSRTPGFRWRDLLAGTARIDFRLVAVFALATGAIGTAIVLALAPQAFLFLPRHNPRLMGLIAAFYPLVSALPQELIFRPLFFTRYRALLPRWITAQLLLNAALFSLAHLMYWSWVVTALTFAGGLVFAWSYRVRGNFPEAVVLHAVAGVILFALGAGVWFYSGNVTRPF
ncbi:CAAX protease self-immunity [Meinhardsimonia xiamenensis]|jgi:membrane protease YdiL (CAAX protease family)|uniref:CAAX protease self-immunity n=1 Tax=Meinhardsimonia xiamenensis TaxID=990712 RepID=A0A1G9EKJ4_9RHOB|nr:CPBP family intramembrane glutamic endopeptidase [Meinhardsimonia xiamenensis]PRX33731.1 CAAX prenyl protease-like protein [Meinhardsimonia xiamenensis]SDK76561.1 CAAX protease self-immunity [Meinhardsimonia xiamenensis]